MSESTEGHFECPLRVNEPQGYVPSDKVKPWNKVGRTKDFLSEDTKKKGKVVKFSEGQVSQEGEVELINDSKVSQT